MWEKWFGRMSFNLVAKEIPEISFEGKCVNESDSENGWSTYSTLWECKTNPKIKLIYRVKIAKDGINSKIEITGPKLLGSVEINGKLFVKVSQTNGDISSPEIKTVNIDIRKGAFTSEYTLDFNNINQISFEGSCFDFGKVYRTKIKIDNDSIHKPFKVKTKTAVIGDRG